jgi:hypothetical protein
MRSPSVGNEAMRVANARIVYLIAIAAATIGWLWLIAWIAMQLI